MLAVALEKAYGLGPEAQRAAETVHLAGALKLAGSLNMAATLRQKVQAQSIAFAALAAVVILLGGVLGLKVLAGVLAVLIGFPLVIGLTMSGIRSSFGQETAEEAEARAEERAQTQGKLAAIEKVAAESTDEKARAQADADLLWKYTRAWEKSNVLVPNAVVEGWRSQPAEIEDGDFEVLAKQRDLMDAMVSRDPKLGKGFLGLSKEIQRIDNSVPKWRKGAEEVRAGIRQGPEHFDAANYLRRLNEAFPPVAKA